MTLYTKRRFIWQGKWLVFGGGGHFRYEHYQNFGRCILVLWNNLIPCNMCK